MKKPYILLLVFSLILGTLSAQDISIGGKIISATDQQPIPGVTVLIKGTSRGTVTDINGVYSLEAPSGGTLQFTYV